MSKAYIQPGKTISFIATAVPAVATDPAHKGGDLVKVGSLIGVCSHDVMTGDQGEMHVVGVFEILKTNLADAFAEGDDVFMDAAGPTAALAGDKIGQCVEVESTATDEVVRVRLNGVQI